MKKNTKEAKDAVHISTNLMNQLSSAGLPLLRGGLNYANTELNNMDRRGLPEYVQQAYAGQRTASAEQAQGEASMARARMRAPGSASQFFNQAPAFAGAAEAYAKENASISAARATTTLSQRNQLLNTLTGGSAGSINLAAGFGGLTNRGLAAGVNAGNPVYEGVMGGTAALSPLLLAALQPNTNSYNAQSYLSEGRAGSRSPLFGGQMW